MANYFAQLAAPQIRNALVDFSPVGNALDTWREQGNADRQFGMQQKQIDAQTAERTYQHGRDAKQDSRQAVSEYGKAALAIDQMEGPQRAAAYQSLMARHAQEFPNEKPTPEELNPVTGPKLMAAQAGQWVDPLDRRSKLLGIQKDEAEIKSLGQKNSLNDAIAGLITGPGSPAPAASTGAPPGNALSAPIPRIQPQSYNAPAQPQNPNLILAADTQTVPQAQPQQQAPPQPDMVQTPLGPMTRQQAQRAGMGLSLAGKDGAGKAMLDSANANALDKTAENQNDKEELAATGQMATLDAVKRSFDPKYLNIGNRLSLWGKALQDKFGALSPSDAKDLSEYTTWRAQTWGNLNRVLKDLSGTAVTENEMQRQLLQQPNPGQGVADGDSPTEFGAKLKNQLAFASSAIARSRYLRSKGFTGKPWEAGISVEAMPDIINQRGLQLEQQLKQQNPQADPMQLQQAVTKQIKQEFGI